ncbi:anthranilate phosphoribosyltransferase [Clostridium tetanomorphum]|uniref:Anthranilate phosphoribosyltransferase n=1 Tax=Clostridium tetanomorphum TaxID=1553 RepID=A0A923J103_CLOTT|nr:anthranilate phosphoribosyltransferase [Clostridium tetanomorphum]KAJ49724.1 anthranilate phosphoribosyltransferase [Clostridium tetanomorphum DSM 665]KAJ52643.1 anthranilate phosphoribosyltransferase [Clostridium tetanomorphum DSM 665]MBC2396803.1 anthranilate phosphoribosyltransferase [Clostridium tetanomorphum]MBP1863236.1 anthranilate phosphoribosyltransferase [Clostridium tetanomorphum]NRS84344.1 anthranilate phosphoribosyltransferase [Clostridium tetanomorphum]
MLKTAINKLLVKENLTEEEAYNSMNEIMKGQGTESQIGAFLVALRMKGESVEEITGCAKAMRDNATKVNIGQEYVIDTCGTGGDGGKTFNISTAASIIAASSGIKIAKHGNVAVSSKSGSADVLSKLGVNINLDSIDAKKCIDKVGIVFLFAQKYHKAMKYAAAPRRELGTRTVFNILGPLTNPAYVKGQVMGVYEEKLTNIVANVLSNLGCKKAMVVHGMDGLDEITTTGATKVSEVTNGYVKDYFINPKEYGLSLAISNDIEGGSSEENAEIILNILKGEKGRKRDIVLLNTAAALYIGNSCNSLKEGLDLAAHLIDSSKAYDKLQQLVQVSNNL